MIRRAMLLRLVCLACLVTLLGSCCMPAALAEEVKVISVFINHTWFSASEFTGYIPEAITQATGITLDVTVANDAQHLNRLITQDKLPDMVYTSTMLERFNDPTLCYSYDELLETYGVEWDMPAQLRANALVYSPDGQVYALLNNYADDEEWQHTSAVPMISSLMVRRDILDAMGVTEIRTTDDLMAVFLRVKEEYPDMVPLTFDVVHRFNFFRCSFGMGLLPFLEQEDGTQRYYARDSRYHEMLRWLNELYRAGCMIPDSFAATMGDSSYLYSTDQAFSFSACTQNTNLSLHNDLIQIDPSYGSVELPPLEGSSYDTQGLGWSGAFITRNARDPKACIELMRWMYSDEGQHLTEWGREGIDYTLDENGLPVFSQDVLDSVKAGTYNTLYNPWFYFGTSAIVEAEGRCALQEGGLSVEAYEGIRQRYRILPWVAAAIAQMSDEDRLIYDRIATSIDYYENKIILSADDAAFERHMTELQLFLESLDVASLEKNMTQSIAQQYDRYQQRTGEVYAR